MDISNIIVPVISLGGMGLVFGAGLAYASQKFAVEVDPRITAIRDVLPGANCGGCGYPGCDGFAAGVIDGKAPANGCPVASDEAAEKIASIMGQEAVSGEKMVARVICAGGVSNSKESFEYYGVEDCKTANMFKGGSKSCKHGCMGLGTCVKVCPFDAIEINDDRLAVINEDKCTGCGKCIDECPKDVIAMVPYDQDVFVDCNSKEKGKEVKQKCEIGCIGCRICVKACPFDAITFDNNLATIDYTKCKNCMICAQKCPTKAIYANFENRKKAEIIDDKCIKCTICKKNCPVDAIEGEVKQPHKILEDKCIGCGICEEKCPKDAILMK